MWGFTTPPCGDHANVINHGHSLITFAHPIFARGCEAISFRQTCLQTRICSTVSSNRDAVNIVAIATDVLLHMQCMKHTPPSRAWKRSDTASGNVVQTDLNNVKLWEIFGFLTHLFNVLLKCLIWSDCSVIKHHRSLHLKQNDNTHNYTWHDWAQVGDGQVWISSMSHISIT